MDSNHAPKRRSRDIRLAPERLESRALLTGGAGNTFAIVPGEVAKAGAATAVKFNIDTTHFTVPKGKVVLGVDVVPQGDSKAKPEVKSVNDANGVTVAKPTRAAYDRSLTSYRATNGPIASAVTTTLKVQATPSKAQSFSVKIGEKSATGAGGKVLVGFFLPGDATGDGVVDAKDISKIKSALGARANDTKYVFDSDANRDGRIDATDLSLAQRNFGVRTTISPVVSANLDPANVSNVQERVTHNSSVKFTGVASPGASIKFEEVSKSTPPASITADPAGNYAVTVPLAAGSNTFKVTTQDAFGQSISGTIAPVKYLNTPPVTSSSQIIADAKTQSSVAVTKS